jgi:hypothetical protein
VGERSHAARGNRPRQRAFSSRHDGDQIMRPWTIGLAAAGLLLSAGAALAADNEAGVPLSPTEAAGGWTLESGGRAICRVELSAQKAGQTGFGAHASGDCGAAFQGAVAGWTPTGDGMALTAPDGKLLLAFNRWSNSLFVSHRSSGVDIQLQRGGPNG